jgi:hypothetical protein
MELMKCFILTLGSIPLIITAYLFSYAVKHGSEGGRCLFGVLFFILSIIYILKIFKLL